MVVRRNTQRYQLKSRQEHMKRHAFTLIELLVVVAIITVLATILFPVLLSTRRSPGSGSTAAHLGQISTAELIYQSDYNDEFILGATNLCDAGCPSTTGGECYQNLPAPTPNWTLILEPYLGSLGFYVDPSTGDPEGIFTPGSPNYQIQNWNADAQFGYNYQFLSPVGSPPGEIITGCQNAPQSSLGRSGAQAVNPSATVMFTTTQGFAAQWSNALAYFPPGNSFANAPGTDFAMLPAYDRVVLVGSVCFGSSGAHNVSGPTAFGYCGWAAADPVGPMTANVRSLSPYPYASVAWVDGHISTATASALGAGTDFATATSASNPDPVYGFATGAIVNGLASSGRGQLQGATNALGLPAPTGYVWSLDGTLSDIN